MGSTGAQKVYASVKSYSQRQAVTKYSSDISRISRLG